MTEPNATNSSSPSQDYYIGIFTVESWREFKRSGGQVMGFNANKAKMVSRLKPGDRILCYLSKVSAFIGVMVVQGESFSDERVIWSDGVFPVRLPVKLQYELPLVLAVPIHTMRDKLSFFPQDKGTGWTIYVRSSPRKWATADGQAVFDALQSRSSQLASQSSHPPSEILKKERKRLKLPADVRVGKLVKRTELIDVKSIGTFGSYDNVLSGNKVTGYSINLPISETCQPTAMCMKTCYFAAGATTWKHSLRHQLRVFEAIKSNPIAFAERVALEYDNLNLNFIRWNGGGDLFAESVECINYLGKVRPDITIWVVTRIPEWASQIDQLPSVYVHFSLDKHSLSRRSRVLSLQPKTSNLFFSYQCDAGEIPPLEKLDGVSVLFFDNYKPTTDLKTYPAEIVCPLNLVSDISGVCEGCRRCFNGTAVSTPFLLPQLT